MNWKFLLDQANRQAQPETKKPFNHQAINEDPKFILCLGKRNVSKYTWFILHFINPYLILSFTHSTEVDREALIPYFWRVAKERIRNLVILIC